jgi:predicted nucleic acid-binding protein
MILLDTNVVSEAIKPDPYPSVLGWLDAQMATTLFISSITVAELLYGTGTLPDGKRKRTLADRIDRLLNEFASRILPFDTAAAQRYGDLAIRARKAGLGFPTPDGYIAAIAAAQGFAVASRDTSAFKAAGLKVFDPWSAAPAAGR